MLNAKLVYEAVKSLDGQNFSSREELEDAVYPFFGTLSSIFHGEGHRDLVDRLISARWVDVVGDKYVILLPKIFNQNSVSPQNPGLVELSMAELQLLFKISGAVDGVPESNLIDQTALNTLIFAGLVDMMDSVSTPERESTQQAIDTAVSLSLENIKKRDYQTAIANLRMAAIKSDQQGSQIFVYKATDKGRTVKFSIK